MKQSAQHMNQEIQILPPSDLKVMFPYLKSESDCIGVYSMMDSGYVNPRQLVYAQQWVCSQEGCEIIREIVDHISPHGSKGWSLTLASDQHITSQKMLVSVGAFCGFHSLLPGKILPDMNLYGVATLLVG